MRRAWHAVARPLGRSRRMRRTPRCLRNLARRPAAAARPIDARSDRVAALSAARVIRLFQTYRVPSPARETDLSPPIRPRRPSCPPRCPPASRRSAPSSPRYVRARPARHAPRRESDDRAPSPSPTVGAFGSVDTVITDILKPPPRATIERPALRRRSRSRLNVDGSFAAPGPRTRPWTVRRTRALKR